MGLLDGLFAKGELTLGELETKKYEKIIQDVKNSEKLNDEEKDKITDYINGSILVDGKYNELSFKSDDFNLILNLYQKQTSFSKFSLYIWFVQDLYESIVVDGNDRALKQYFFKILKIALSKHSELLTFILGNYNCVMNLFERKELFISFLENIPSNMERVFMINYITYIIEARRYYIDETQYLTRIILVCKKYLNAEFNKDIFNKLIEEDRRCAGIYDVSLSDIEMIEESMSSLKKEVSSFIEKTRLDLEQVSKNVSSLENSYVNEIDKKFAKIISLLVGYSMDMNSKKDEMDKYYEMLVKEMNGLKEEIDRVVLNLVNGEATKITSDYQDCISLINRMISGSKNMGTDYRDTLKQVLEILKRIVSFVNDNKDKCVVNETDNVQKVSNVDTGMNRFLDPSRSLKDRLEMALANKKPGEMYHASVDKVIKEILNKNTVYLVGPSGSCKTYSMKQIAEILELPLYNFGFVTDEHETFKSYKDVNGNFVENMFYHAYKNGGICFYDEIDNSESKALVELNRIIGGNGEYEAYLFPNGELVYPHPNLIIATAGNTYGEGASELYSTREKLDFGTVDRVHVIEYYYDRNLEKKVLEKYPKMFDFCMAYREVLENIGYDYSFTTRKIFKIKKNLDSGCYSAHEIVSDFFINGIRIDVLENIKNNIKLNGNIYYEAFASIVESRKKVYTRRRGR